MMNIQEALAFAKSSAVMAFDQRDAYDDPIASYRQNIRDTLVERQASMLEPDCFEVYDTAVARLFMAIYRVYVAKPLGPRERKQSVLIYRVGASSPKDAVAAVRKMINDPDGIYRDREIVDVERFSDVASVVLDGVVNRTPAELAEWKERRKAKVQP